MKTLTDENIERLCDPKQGLLECLEEFNTENPVMFFKVPNKMSRIRAQLTKQANKLRKQKLLLEH